MLYVAEHGCKWRGLPKRFGNWHTIYTRMRRWAKSDVLDKIFEELQREQENTSRHLYFLIPSYRQNAVRSLHV